MKILQSKLGIVLILASFFQLSILSGEYLLSVYPIWVGQKVTLAIAPVDPRSLFRGQYARLNYDIASIKRDSVNSLPGKIRYGDEIFVTLEQRPSHWIATKASFQKPADGVFIRGRLKGNHSNRTLQVEYGIEAYFASAERARDIENDLRRANRRGRKIATAEVMVAPNGRATLVGVNTKQLVRHEEGSASTVQLAQRNGLELGKRVNENEFSTGSGNFGKAYCTECPSEIEDAKTHTLHFDGESDSLFVPDDWRLGSQQFTISAWVSLDRVPQEKMTLLARQSPGERSGYGLKYVVRDDGEAGFEGSFVDFYGATHKVFSPVTAKPHSWYWVALILDDGKRELIVDGKASRNLCYVKGKTGKTKNELCSKQVSINFRNSPLRIGAPTFGSRHYWAGRIAGLSFYPEVLTKEELLEHMERGRPF
jgi:uncharacterized membrane-anchored protein